MLLSLVRHIPQANASMKAKKWEKKKFMGIEIYKKTLGIIGLGNVGTEVAKRAKGLKMNVIAYDPFVSVERAKQLQVKMVSLDELLRTSDFITIHTPLNDDTYHLINEETISKMKDGVFIINCARGGIVDEKALAEAIKSGKVAGAAIDVFEKEPPDEDNPLVPLDKVICTPHLGASTYEAQENVAIAIAEQIIDYFKYGVIRNAVNVPSIPPEVLHEMQPFMTLAEKLGSLEAQIIEGQIEEIRIFFGGELAKKDVTCVTLSALLGFLKPVMGEEVNLVNASLMAKERGIRVVEVKDTSIENYSNLLTISVTSNKEKRSISGMVIDNKNIRIVNI